MAAIVPIDRLETWQRLAHDGQPLVVFKHSTTCPISAEAARQFRAWAEALGQGGPRLYQIEVREQAVVSRRIAADTGIAHRSPQVLYLRGGRVVWHASHQAIVVEALRRAIG